MPACETWQIVANEAWGRLGERLDRFADAWSRDGPVPKLMDFALMGPGKLRRLSLVELIKADLEAMVRLDRPR